MAELEVRMKLKGHGLATPDELALRHKFQAEIDARGIGKDLGGGSGLVRWTFLSKSPMQRPARAAFVFSPTNLGWAIQPQFKNLPIRNSLMPGKT
jgi:hypothetical protein